MYITVGPATPLPVLRDLISAGATNLRINFSHGATKDHTGFFDLVKQAAKEVNIKVNILGDIQGPKLRIGKVDSFMINPGEYLTLDSNPAKGDKTRVYLPHADLMAAMEMDATVLINDGEVMMIITEVNKDSIKCVCKRGGEISSSKGISAPGCVMKGSILADYDKECILNGLANKMDYCLLSFV